MLYHATTVLEGAGMMGLLTATDWRVAKAIAGIGHVNPFLTERVDLERQALGTRFKEEGPLIWMMPPFTSAGSSGKRAWRHACCVS